jgi:hypothetical protein
VQECSCAPVHLADIQVVIRTRLDGHSLLVLAACSCRSPNSGDTHTGGTDPKADRIPKLLRIRPHSLTRMRLSSLWEPRNDGDEDRPAGPVIRSSAELTIMKEEREALLQMTRKHMVSRWVETSMGPPPNVILGGSACLADCTHH